MADLEKLTRIREITAGDAGSLEIKIALMVVEAGTVLGSRTHSVTILPGEDIAAILDGVSQHISVEGQVFLALTMLGAAGGSSETRIVYPPIEAGDVAKVQARADEAWTPDILAVWDKKRADEAAAAEEARKREEEAAAEAASIAAEQAKAQEQRFREMVAAEVARVKKGAANA